MTISRLRYLEASSYIIFGLASLQ